ncbi:MAG: PIG-L family deacetylase [Propionibacteriaceae bacterium]|jgi:N-acetyl-1-D-myo-inositol-2-amino-2-deoxy-alpha-D-glucopyranoside deacetylase|nr:PIG-L family deacetylase [Propionibacteriaceae bacterium]
MGEGQPRRVAILHAHPDDETLSTGPLILDLAAQGIPVAVVTATRGELGEIVPGSLPPGADLVAAREAEVRRATAILGAEHCFLGTPPARAGGTERRYRDSGMAWVTPTLAGPAPNADAAALANVGLAAPTADFAAFCRAWGATEIVSYDDAGGYGHPDHVACHRIAAAAAAELGLPCWEAAPEADGTAPADALVAALTCYATQLRVSDGQIVHVGGQRQAIATRVALKCSRKE